MQCILANSGWSWAVVLFQDGIFAAIWLRSSLFPSNKHFISLWKMTTGVKFSVETKNMAKGYKICTKIWENFSWAYVIWKKTRTPHRKFPVYCWKFVIISQYPSVNVNDSLKRQPTFHTTSLTVPHDIPYVKTQLLCSKASVLTFDLDLYLSLYRCLPW